jgi:hypothetical protein
VNLPNPVKLGLTIRYFNYDNVDLYFQITGSGPGYTFATVNLGLLASGANAYINLDEFASRARPSPSDLPNGEKEENITLILKAYTDSNYTNLKWTFERVVTVHWINSADPAWTVNMLNNFDDGTVQGWAVANESGNYSGYPTIGVATDYVLSPPYSCKMTQTYYSASYGTRAQLRARLYKTVTTPDKDVVYAIFDIRVSTNKIIEAQTTRSKNLRIQKDSEVLIFLGKPYDTVNADYIPENKWVRIVIPLPKNVTIELRIVHEYSVYVLSTGYNYYSGFVWLDDFKIISK